MALAFLFLSKLLALTSPFIGASAPVDEMEGARGERVHSAACPRLMIPPPPDKCAAAAAYVRDSLLFYVVHFEAAFSSSMPTTVTDRDRDRGVRGNINNNNKCSSCGGGGASTRLALRGGKSSFLILHREKLIAQQEHNEHESSCTMGNSFSSLTCNVDNLNLNCICIRAFVTGAEPNFGCIFRSRAHTFHN